MNSLTSLSRFSVRNTVQKWGRTDMLDGSPCSFSLGCTGIRISANPCRFWQKTCTTTRICKECFKCKNLLGRLCKCCKSFDLHVLYGICTEKCYNKKFLSLQPLLCWNIWWVETIRSGGKLVGRHFFTRAGSPTHSNILKAIRSLHIRLSINFHATNFHANKVQIQICIMRMCKSTVQLVTNGAVICKDLHNNLS